MISAQHASELAHTRWRSPAAVDQRVDALARLIRARLATMPLLTLSQFYRLTDTLTERVGLDDQPAQKG